MSIYMYITLTYSTMYYCDILCQLSLKRSTALVLLFIYLQYILHRPWPGSSIGCKTQNFAKFDKYRYTQIVTEHGKIVKGEINLSIKLCIILFVMCSL